MIRPSTVLDRICFAISISCILWVNSALANQLDSDIRLFTVLTAINLAGYDDGISSASVSPVRQAIRNDLREFNASSLQSLKAFYEQNIRTDPGSTLSQYVSYALIAGDPPHFELSTESPLDLPPDVRRIRGFSSILAEFYSQAPIERLWSKYQPYFDREIERYQQPLIQALFEAAGYVRMSPSSREVQSFQVFFDLLGNENQINIRSYHGKVYVVIHPSMKLRVNEIRHAFLLHLLDRLALRNADHIAKKEILSRFALFAPALESMYKTNFQLLVSKSLVKAIEARLLQSTDVKRYSQIQQDLREGYILTPYFFNALSSYEKQSLEMRLYYPEMIQAIDLKNEAQQLQKVKFSEVSDKNIDSSGIAPQTSKVERLLHRGEVFLADGKPLQARKQFELALSQTKGPDPDILYGLARVALAEGDSDLALEFFNQILNSFPDSHVESMSLIYLGRIADITGTRVQAISHYRSALSVTGISDRVRHLANDGIKNPFGLQKFRALTEKIDTPEDDLYDDEAAAWGDEGDWDDEEPNEGDHSNGDP